MKLVKFEYNNQCAEGVVMGDLISVIGAMVPGPGTETPFTLPSRSVDDIERLVKSSALKVPLSDVRLCVPVSPTSKIICLGYNYKTHIEETAGPEGEYPTLFARWPDSLVGHGEHIIRPSASICFDYEGEFAVVIGKGGRRIPRQSALDHVLGYSCFLDGSVRDYQKHSPTAGKNFPQTGAMGPWIVAGEAARLIAERFDLETRVNDTKVQATTSDLMVFDVPTIVSYVSEFTRLSPGDVIATGTPGGVGSRRTPPLWLKHDDKVEVEISGIGILENRVGLEENDR